MNKKEKQFIKEELLLRDYLASERTMMSIDRTFLSYVRTALTFFIVGISLLKFFDTLFVHIVGWLFLPAAIVTFTLGMYRTLAMANIISERAVRDGYEMDFPQSIVRQRMYDFNLLLSGIFKRVSHFFVPSEANQNGKN